MYRTKVIILDPQQEGFFKTIDAQLAKIASEGFGLVGAPIFIPYGPNGALLYTFADLREEKSEELPKPTIVTNEGDELTEQAEAHFAARRQAQGE